MLALSYQLTDLPDRAAYLSAAAACLGELLPGDDTFWLETDLARGTAVTRRGAGMTADPELARLLVEAHDHPAILSYLVDPADLSPRRLSDVVAARDWRATSAHALLNGTMGRHQLSLIVRLAPPARGDGWTVGRSGLDPTDDERDLAAELLPLLTTLDRVYGRPLPALDPALDDVRRRLALTPREVQILSLVAEGLTAVAIGHVHRISSATVRKHLQHVYDKLGCHDRLLAVQEARRLGVLPPVVSTR